MFKIPDMSILQVSINFQPNQRKILLKTFEKTGGQSEVDAEKVRDIRAVRDNFVKKIFGDFAVVYIILRYDEQKGHPRLTN